MYGVYMCIEVYLLIGKIYIIYIIRLVCVDNLWLTGHLWKSEYTVCAG
jgi:hypothetical protein